jgi:hypothetical protein
MEATTDSTTVPTFRKEIRYDRLTHDYALYLDGELVGFAATYHDGERTLDELAHSILTHQHTSQEAA